jgi:spectinomycin phosphotransferase/16S rRNA (guanine(1405)-N(7))-methyltransferase
VLVDWDTALLAPPEHDLWMLAAEDPAVIDAYVAATGRAVRPEVIDLYRRGWDLEEVAIYTALFRAPHARSEDIDESWTNLHLSIAKLLEE